VHYKVSKKGPYYDNLQPKEENKKHRRSRGKKKETSKEKEIKVEHRSNERSEELQKPPKRNKSTSPEAINTAY
jgi:hypothetical protein